MKWSIIEQPKDRHERKAMKGQFEKTASHERTAMTGHSTVPMTLQQFKDSHDIIAMTGQEIKIIDHFTLIRFSMSFTTPLGRPHSLEDTGMGGSTTLMMSLLMVFSLSWAAPHTN